MSHDRLIMPKLVVSLEASDEFLRERIINLPEIVVVGTHNVDESFTRRLTEYRAINTDEETVLNYFDELEFHPERIGHSLPIIIIIVIVTLTRGFKFIKSFISIGAGTGGAGGPARPLATLYPSASDSIFDISTL